MDVLTLIHNYLHGLPEPKRGDMQGLHERTLQTAPDCKLWFTDGRNSEGKVIANPGIGYGSYTIRYADGTTREFYQVGLSANKTGISVYIMGLSDKTWLSKTYGGKLGKASITGYCIRFRKITDINLEVLEAAIRHRLEPRS